MRERIIKILEDKEITQTEFAAIIGVNPSSVTHLMRGRDKFSQTVASRTLLAFPDINFLWMLKGEGEMYLKTAAKQTENIQDMNLTTNTIEEDTAHAENNEFIDNQQERKQREMSQKFNIRNISSAEDAIRPFEGLMEAVSHSIPQGNTQTLEQPKERKKVEKIVFFYSDQSFEEYYPTS